MEMEIVVLKSVLANGKDQHQFKAGLAQAIKLLEAAEQGIANSAIWQEEVRMAIVDRLAPDDRPHPLPPTFAACIHRIADMREEARDQRDRAHRDSAYAERLRKFIEALPCPNPLCQDGSIISTGPDPQNDPCEWCMDRHYTLQPDSQVAPVEPLTGQRCYLAGPMRGYPQFNFPAFFAAAKSLRERGYEVWSPAENDVHQDGFDPAKDAAQPMRHYMKRDLPAVLDADFVAVLPGWEHSQGATLEVTVARTCGIPVLDAATLAVAPRVEDNNTAKDAARWRWWCRWWFDEKDDMETINDLDYSDKEGLDAEIDAAINKAPEEAR